MKRAVIVGLVCVNVVLVLALMFGTETRRASAQTKRGGNDYLMMTGRIEQSFSALYILDLKTRRLAALKFDRVRKRLVPLKGRVLEGDFRTTGVRK